MRINWLTSDRAPTEIAFQITNAQVKVILTHPSKIDDVLEAAAATNFPKDRIFHFSEDVSGTVGTVKGLRDWTAFLPSATDAAAWKWPSLSPAEAATQLATINYSSGTTGVPKGVCVTHRNLIANVEQGIGARYPDGVPAAAAQRVSVAFLPLYHAFGQMASILAVARLRTPVYLMAVFHFERFLAHVQRYRATTLNVVPPVLVMLAKRPEVARYDLSSLKEILCGAAPLKTALQNDVADRFGVVITQGWGMTEAVCTVTRCPEGFVDRRASCGKLIPNVRAKFVDEDGREVAMGEPGELYIQGPNIMAGYWRNEKATRETLSPDGWLKTGDVAVYDKDGLIWIVDRKKVSYTCELVAYAMTRVLIEGYRNSSKSAATKLPPPSSKTFCSTTSTLPTLVSSE